jgi:GMP synthase (glutamine-hydrolysing)
MLDQTTAETSRHTLVGADQSAQIRRGMKPGRRLQPILIILHQETSIPAHVGRDLSLMGHPLDIRRPRFGDPLPETLEHHDGAVIFGGPMSANDPDDFIKVETDWISVPIRENKPFLGICLGAQMIARFLGAQVALDPDERCGIGYHPVEPLLPAINDVPWPTTVYQWHREGFELPSGAELIVRADTTFQNQAFKYGSGTAIQFHPEITYLQVCRWSGNSPHRLALPCAQDRPTQLHGHVKFSPAVHRWRRAFLASWLGHCDATAG